MSAPEQMTPEEHGAAMEGPLEAIVPLMEGALYFAPSALCVSVPEKGEPLTEAGREFAGVIYHLTVDAHRAAWDAVGGLDYKGEPYKKAHKALDRLTLCLLFARALMDPDLPSSLSSHDALERLHKEAGKAYLAITGRPLKSRVGADTEKEV